MRRRTYYRGSCKSPFDFQHSLTPLMRLAGARAQIYAHSLRCGCRTTRLPSFHAFIAAAVASHLCHSYILSQETSQYMRRWVSVLLGDPVRL